MSNYKINPSSGKIVREIGRELKVGSLYVFYIPKVWSWSTIAIDPLKKFRIVTLDDIQASKDHENSLPIFSKHKDTKIIETNNALLCVGNNINCGSDTTKTARARKRTKYKTITPIFLHEGDYVIPNSRILQYVDFYIKPVDEE